MDGGKFSKALQSVLCLSSENLSIPQRKHFRWFVFAMLVNLRASKLIHLSAVAPRAGHRTSVGRFLNADWDAVDALSYQSLGTLKSMNPKCGETIYLIIDDTKIEKRGKKMDLVSKIFDHKTSRFIYGHTVVTAVIMFRNVVLPWRFQVQVPKSVSGAEHLKLTQVAASLVTNFQFPWDFKVRVLFDSFYLSPCVTKACESRGFTWFSVASRNRKFTRRHSHLARRIGEFAPGVIRSEGKNVRMRRAKGWRSNRLAPLDGRLGRTGRVRMVISKRPKDPWNKLLAVVTTETNLSAREIMVIYERRWQIEVMFKELRSSLGLCDYQVLSRNAIERHLHLCGITYQVLTHHSLKAQGAQTRKANKEIKLPQFRERFESLRNQILSERAEAMLTRIRDSKTRNTVRQFLNDELRIAA